MNLRLPTETKFKVVVAPQNQEYNIRTCGAQGIAGAQGKSAYQVAVDNGFMGTEMEWLESLHGTVDDLTTDEDFVAQYLLIRG